MNWCALCNKCVARKYSKGHGEWTVGGWKVEIRRSEIWRSKDQIWGMVPRPRLRPVMRRTDHLQPCIGTHQGNTITCFRTCVWQWYNDNVSSIYLNFMGSRATADINVNTMNSITTGTCPSLFQSSLQQQPASLGPNIQQWWTSQLFAYSKFQKRMTNPAF